MTSGFRGSTLWNTRLLLLGMWATLWLLWRRGGSIGFPTNPVKLFDEVGLLTLFVIIPGVILLLGVPARRIAAGILGVLIVGGLVAESISARQEQEFVSRCKASSGPVILLEHRFPGERGGWMLFMRDETGKETLMGFD